MIFRLPTILGFYGLDHQTETMTGRDGYEIEAMLMNESNRNSEKI